MIDDALLYKICRTFLLSIYAKPSQIPKTLEEMPQNLKIDILTHYRIMKAITKCEKQIRKKN